MIRERARRVAGAEEEIAMRSLALAALAAFCISSAATATPSDAGRTVFDVTRNGQPFGRHTIAVTGSGDQLRAQSDVAFRVDVGPMTMFRLEQSCTEIWSSGELSGLNCSTLKDGRRTRVRGEVRDGRLFVTGADGEHWFPLGAFPTTWWTQPPTSASALIDTQTGAPMRVRVTRMGRETIDAGGQRIQAERIRVQGALTADLWYDDQGRWVGCAFTVRGQHIQYRLASPLSGLPA
jgi:hypothetical protein